MSGNHRLAAIDVGTVTTRLLVAQVGPNGVVEEVARSVDITHLGEGLAATGRLESRAMGRVATVVESYAEIMEALDVDAYSAVATSATRDAGNGREFAAMLAERGIVTTVIDGAREAELAFLGATAQLDGEGLLVVDCGGGSTELIYGSAASNEEGRRLQIDVARSIDVGSRRMTELYLRSDPPPRSELDRARHWAVGELRGYFDRLDERPHTMIGLAGTATSLAAIQLELAEYDAEKVHGHVLTGPDIAGLLEMLAGMPLASRREVVGLHPERAGVIVAGTLIFETVLALAGLDSVVVSEHDILYGILLDTYLHLRE